MRPLMILTLALASACATTPSPTSSAMSLHELKTRTLAGDPVDLSDYRGQVLLIVNTASECGYTPQYEGLEKLHAELKGKGFSVIGFPSNDFGGQEPGTEKEIREFCTVKFNVQFPLMEKVKTKGEDQSPVYSYLSTSHGEPKWNFHKYLVGKDGKVKAAFKSGVTPGSDELRTAIDAALSE